MYAAGRCPYEKFSSGIIAQSAFEWFGLDLAIFLQEDLDLAFRLFQFFSARRGQIHAFLEKS
jgi:hypothetical protein